MRGGVRGSGREEGDRSQNNKYLDSFRVNNQKLQCPALAVSKNSFIPLEICESMRENRNNTRTTKDTPAAATVTQLFLPVVFLQQDAGICNSKCAGKPQTHEVTLSTWPTMSVWDSVLFLMPWPSSASKQALLGSVSADCALRGVCEGP